MWQSAENYQKHRLKFEANKFLMGLSTTPQNRLRFQQAPATTCFVAELHHICLYFSKDATY